MQKWNFLRLDLNRDESFDFLLFVGKNSWPGMRNGNADILNARAGTPSAAVVSSVDDASWKK